MVAPYCYESYKLVYQGLTLPLEESLILVIHLKGFFFGILQTIRALLIHHIDLDLYGLKK